MAVLCYRLQRAEMEAFASHLKISRNDLSLLRQVADLKQAEPKLDQPDLSNRQIYALLRHSSPASRMICWLCSRSERVRDRLRLYETELQHVRPVVDGEYLKSIGLKPSPLFSRLLNAVRDARLDGEIHAVEEEKALIAQLLRESDKA
jgi:tRNA nucleotidyltransferase (CCA-adding enzyme)